MFNMTYGNIILNKGEAIAQLILKKIATPKIVQVVELPHTVRGTRGFGSTNQTVTVQTATPTVQLGTIAWTNLMNKLLPRKREPIDDTSTSSQCTYQQLHVLTAELPNNEWINPFSIEDGGYDSSTSFYSTELDTFDEQIMTYMDLDEGLEMDYPILRTNEGIYASSSAISRYSPPEDTMMGPPQYAPVTGQPVVQNLYQNLGLPDLEIPPEKAYIILETDGSMTGWGGVCKWKPKKVDPRSMEKLSRLRWIAFTDFVTGTGVKVNFEHIDGKLNVFADSLSRLVECSETVAVLTEEGLGGSTQFPLLTEYEDLIHDATKNIIFPEEHKKRQRMKEIEDQAIRNASLAITELELIQQMKEYDFNHRKHLGGGRDNYWAEKLPIIQET
ncbi:hypothetical protein ZIOFF_002007 [Zingiber officinale]|uniref:dUTPase-like domain-containing protein n=1 Tax=Zingiber officinale TaxID=94328 RepID=A0A8J5IKM6_ZINOF|nr:hypothetical protein ZIOFF_002007 [Zingiber officinale]